MCVIFHAQQRVSDIVLLCTVVVEQTGCFNRET